MANRPGAGDDSKPQTTHAGNGVLCPRHEARAWRIVHHVTAPAVPTRLRSAILPSPDGLPGRYKIRLPHGHTVYEVRIDEGGKVTQVDGRMVQCNADLGFRMEDALSVEAY